MANEGDSTAWFLAGFSLFSSFTLVAAAAADGLLVVDAYRIVLLLKF